MNPLLSWYDCALCKEYFEDHVFALEPHICEDCEGKEDDIDE